MCIRDRSNTFIPARTFAWRTTNAFQRRCSPADMTSFIRSYFDATESNTPATRRDLSDSFTSVKPKCVVDGLAMMTAARSAWRGNLGCQRRIAARACCFQLRQIFIPQAALIGTQLIQVLPRIDAARVPVRKERLH